MRLKHKFRKFLWNFGYDISRFAPTSHPLAQRKQILECYKIDTVLDIGANFGQFAQQLREDLGYKSRILSFEPLTSAFASLKTQAAGDPAWEVFNFALGDREEKCEINIAGNSTSSSFLNMLPAHLKSAPESRYVGKEVIDIKTLDSIFGDWYQPSNSIYMKIDTQGFESKVLKGSEKSLARINTIQMEMSLVPLYEGELLFNEMCELMQEKGYRLLGIETGLIDQSSGQLLQVDGTFHRQ